ncbi:hypothetical protein DFO77_11785 [Marinilabilia salmonicolor]|jgi:hypothetical protein|uniref:Uncharacterized protein n=1 Tax=Marinilabilia salmonicolor TaxID=989 RepID=A0A2T0XRY3_9BACT|nr:hypothetical protein BY457_102105 [Marinilabilia salmonicolor]RCW31639.1 hypothetical protein DFO77_11785 [Marinilabilia salmonicolor]
MTVKLNTFLLPSASPTSACRVLSYNKNHKDFKMCCLGNFVSSLGMSVIKIRLLPTA